MKQGQGISTRLMMKNTGFGNRVFALNSPPHLIAKAVIPLPPRVNRKQRAHWLPLRHKGFTLIEVLIALTLLSIMVVLLFGSLKIGADSWERGENKIAEVNEVAVVYNFFQRHLISAKPLWDDFSGEERTLSFQGDSQSLQFVSSFPASAGKAGLQLFSIKLLEEDDEQFINVTLKPFFPVPEGEQFAKEEVTLVSHVSNFKLAYFGSEDGVSDPNWQNQWLGKEIQPRLVKINIELENQIYWPEMVFDLKVSGSHDNIAIQAEDATAAGEEELQEQ